MVSQETAILMYGAWDGIRTQGCKNSTGGERMLQSLGLKGTPYAKVKLESKFQEELNLPQSRKVNNYPNDIEVGN